MAAGAASQYLASGVAQPADVDAHERRSSRRHLPTPKIGSAEVGAALFTNGMSMMSLLPNGPFGPTRQPASWIEPSRETVMCTSLVNSRPNGPLPFEPRTSVALPSRKLCESLPKPLSSGSGLQLPDTSTSEQLIDQPNPTFSPGNASSIKPFPR